ncbi:MAG TPA: transcriptional regulator [Elusimicrobia bacterium]|jgi:SOS-response transcriptional repressor LexA|nr:transcriptional regulator [Elusimicrobiota bacterium]
MNREIMFPLTDYQTKTLQFIIDHIDEYRFPPTINEIQSKIGIKNPGLVHKVLLALEKKKYIVKNKGMHRGIFLTEISQKMPNSKHLIKKKAK